MTFTVGVDSGSRVQIGPKRSALNSTRAGASTRSLLGDGSGAESGYEISIDLPGLRPIGPRVPMVSVMV